MYYISSNLLSNIMSASILIFFSYIFLFFVESVNRFEKGAYIHGNKEIFCKSHQIRFEFFYRIKTRIPSHAFTKISIYSINRLLLLDTEELEIV